MNQALLEDLLIEEARKFFPDNKKGKIAGFDCYTALLEVILENGYAIKKMRNSKAKKLRKLANKLYGESTPKQRRMLKKQYGKGKKIK